MTTDPLVIVDIGARYGIHPSWRYLSKDAIFHLVEADYDESIRLKFKYRSDKNIIVHNCA